MAESPILLWQPSGGNPPGAPGTTPPIYTQADVTPLVEGQEYVDVVFGSIQTDDEWVLVACEVENTTDFEPLNIWPGIVTDRTAAGFRIQLNGLPDSGNYYLRWAVSGVNITPSPATTYFLAGPATGGIHVDSTAFTVSLPPSTTVVGTLTVTPSDGASGTFTPASVALTSSIRTATFTYMPDIYGAAVISVTNSGGLIDPADVNFTCVVTGYAFSGPVTGEISVASTDFTLELPVGGTVIGTVTVTPDDAGAGGTFTPTTVGLTTIAPSDTFTYTPVSTGDKTLSVTNDGGLTDPDDIVYAVTSPPFDPSTIAGLQLWLKADALALADGDPVASWPNYSGPYTLTATGTERPTYKTGIVNGKPVLRFNGTTNRIYKVADLITVQPDTVFVVAKATGSTTGWYFLGDDAFHIFVLQSPTGNVAIYAGGSVVADAVDHTGAFHVFTGVFNGASSAVYVDGTSVASGSAGTTGVGEVCIMSNSPGSPSVFSPGDFAEILIYDTALGSTDRTNVTNYLKTKYAIP